MDHRPWYTLGMSAETYDSYNCDLGWEVCNRRLFDRKDPSPFFWFLMYNMYTFKAWLGRLSCHFFGHTFVDEGYAGPESGEIDLVCQRCNWSSHTVLY